MKFGIVGGGFGYDCHYKALLNIEGTEIIGITDSGSENLISKLSNPNLYIKNFDDLLSLKPDIISIVTPPISHFNLISKSLQKNIHVLCEKPFCSNSIDSFKSLSLAEKAKLGNCVNFQYRFEPGIQFLKSKLDYQLIGKVNHIHFTWLTSGKANPESPWTWRNDLNKGGGVINAFLVHCIDLIQWLLGSEISAIENTKSKVIISNRKNNQSVKVAVTAEDLIEVDLEINKDITAYCKVSNCVEKSSGMRIIINGTNGKLIYEHKPPFRSADQSVVLKNSTTEKVLFNASNIIPPHISDTRIYSLKELYKLFIASIKDDNQTAYPNFKTGHNIQKILDQLR